VRLGQGSNPGGGSTDASPVRRMAGPAAGDWLNYQLYSDSSYTTVWGNDGTSDVDTDPVGGGPLLGQGAGAGNVISLTIYGRVPSGQSPNAGAYSDTVVAAVDF
jgi:spore coat protein U-like protein